MFAGQSYKRRRPESRPAGGTLADASDSDSLTRRMAKVLKSLIRKTILGGFENLVSLDDPYRAIAKLVRSKRITALLDAGASTGRVGKKLLRFFPDAVDYAFEPQPLYRDMLLKLSKENPRIRPQFFALSDKEGEVNLQIAESPGITSIYPPNQLLRSASPKDSAIHRVERIPCVTIDGWARRNAVPSIEIMKFDIQGAEAAALRGAREVLGTSTLVVYTEVMFNSLYEGGALFGEVDQTLRESNFVLYNIYKPHCGPEGLIRSAMFLYIHPDRVEW